MPDVMCMVGIMVEFNAVTRGTLRDVELFEKHAAGAEGNVAIGVSRLGCGWGITSKIRREALRTFLGYE